jgi:uncharacterized protein YidB (DUF937 family)
MYPMDSLKAGLSGITEKITGENPKLLSEVTKLVQNMPDGVSGLLKQFQDRGLGQIVSSWTGKGPKLSISPQQVVQGLGSEKINALAKASELDPKAVSENLAGMLPKVVEQLTPLAKLG